MNITITTRSVMLAKRVAELHHELDMMNAEPTGP